MREVEPVDVPSDDIFQIISQLLRSRRHSTRVTMLCGLLMAELEDAPDDFMEVLQAEIDKLPRDKRTRRAALSI